MRVGLEIEREDLEVSGGAETEVDGAGHGAGGEVGRIGSEGDERRSRSALDAGHGAKRKEEGEIPREGAMDLCPIKERGRALSRDHRSESLPSVM